MDSVNIREAVPPDFERIYNLDPSRKAEFVPSAATLEDVLIEADDGLIAYGVLKLFVEAVMVLTKDASKRVRASALERLMGVAIGACVHRKIEELHTFVDHRIMREHPEFASILQRHFGFRPVDGVALVKDLRV